MKVIAQTNVKYKGTWYKADETFNIDNRELESISAFVKPVGGQRSEAPKASKVGELKPEE